jgi:hypothetical protein
MADGVFLISVADPKAAGANRIAPDDYTRQPDTELGFVVVADLLCPRSNRNGMGRRKWADRCLPHAHL